MDEREMEMMKMEKDNKQSSLSNFAIISFKDKAVLIDGKEVRGITDIEMKKHANDIADVTIKLKAYVNGLDVD